MLSEQKKIKIGFSVINDIRTLDFFEVIFRDLFDVLQDRLQLDDPRHLPLHNGALMVGWERG